jgi:hypothetical protein
MAATAATATAAVMTRPHSTAAPWLAAAVAAVVDLSSRGPGGDHEIIILFILDSLPNVTILLCIKDAEKGCPPFQLP